MPPRAELDAFAAKLTAAVEALKVGAGDADGTEIGPLINAQGMAAIDATPDSFSSGLSPVPCEICYATDVEVVVDVDPFTGTFDIDMGSTEVILETIELLQGAIHNWHSCRVRCRK